MTPETTRPEIPDVTDMIVCARNTFWRPATLLLLIAAMLGIQTLGAPSAALASFKASTPLAAPEKIFGEGTAIAQENEPDLSLPDEPAIRGKLAAPASSAATSPEPVKVAEVASKKAPVTVKSVSASAASAKAPVADAPGSAVTSASNSQGAPCESAPCQPECKPCPPRTGDEVWLVSSRCLGCPDVEGTPPNFGVWRFDLDTHQWNASTLQAFFADQNTSKTDVVWVHGYRIDAAEAYEQGLGVYEQLTCGAPSDRPIRLIIYSWAATPCAGIIEDTRMKAARTNSEGYYLAWLVNQIDRRVTVDFIGYSFGARIVTGSLELLAGGSLIGRTLPAPLQHRAAMQTVLIAAAVNDDWLAMDRPHGQALNAVDRMLALNNGCDRALKHYAIIDPCSKPEALGYTGAVGPLGDNGRKLYEIDLCCTVGKQHNWKSYFYTPSVVARMRPYVGLGQDVPAGKPELIGSRQ